jgi:hypothetical protein
MLSASRTRCKHNALGNASIKKVSPNNFAHVSPKFFPGVALREDVDRQTLGAIAPIDLLRDFEDEFAHAVIFSLLTGCAPWQPSS